MTVELLNTYGVLHIGVAEFLFDLDDLPIIKGRGSWYCDKDGYLVSSYFLLRCPAVCPLSPIGYARKAGTVC